MKQLAFLAAVLFLVYGCATSRDLTSKYYLPEWENRVINIPSPSETSSGFWAVKTVQKVSYGIGRTVLIPFAFVGNILMNAYYIPTWPFRWLLRGDKRLMVWHPLFRVGQEVASDYYSKEWNRDLV